MRRKTRVGRLKALDRLLLAHHRPLLERRDGLWAGAVVVDVGLGMQPWTTVELAEALRQELAQPPEVVGVDVDPELVTTAHAWARPGVRFDHGDLGWSAGHARVVRALNVLRDRTEGEVPAAHAALGAGVVPGGVVLEGTCSPSGEVGVVHCLRRAAEGLEREALWMWTDGSQGSAPLLFRDRMPRDLRRWVRHDHPLGQLMAAWMDAYRASAGGGLDRLAASVEALGRPELAMIGAGAVAWAPVRGVPGPKAEAF